LVAVNLGGIPDGLFESELFGHVKGAFTDAKVDRVGRFELAEGGTLFLDEIANLPLPQQAKLLRVLETGALERVGSSRPQRGNVRKLDHTIERAVLMAEETVVRTRDLGLGAAADGATPLDQMSLEDVERVLIQKALARAAGNVSDAAKALGLSRSALYRRLK